MSSRRQGRRVPPKARTTSAASQPGSASDSGTSAETIGSADRPLGTRSANRAAKRVATGVRPKVTARGRSGGGKRSSNTGIIVLAIGAAAIGAAVLLLGNPFGAPAASPTPAASSPIFGDGTCPTAEPAPLAATDVKTVTIVTKQGTIVMEIDGVLAPIATGNFIALSECHFYDGVVFHRLVPGFVIQGGDPEGTGGGGPGYTIADDPITTTYHRGTVAMARTRDPHSQGSQFFIVLADSANSALSGASPGYAILGEVTTGMDVVDAIAAMPNSGDANGNAALDPVTMTSVTVTDGPPPTSAPSATAPTVATSPAPSTPSSTAPAATQ